MSRQCGAIVKRCTIWKSKLSLSGCNSPTPSA